MGRKRGAQSGVWKGQCMRGAGAVAEGGWGGAGATCGVNPRTEYIEEGHTLNITINGILITS